MVNDGSLLAFAGVSAAIIVFIAAGQAERAQKLFAERFFDLFAWSTPINLAYYAHKLVVLLFLVADLALIAAVHVLLYRNFMNLGAQAIYISKIVYLMALTGWYALSIAAILQLLFWLGYFGSKILFLFALPCVLFWVLKTLTLPNWVSPLIASLLLLILLVGYRKF